MSRTPDYDLAALNKATGEKQRVGCAWKDEDGRIAIKLNSWTVLKSDPDLVLTLFVKRPFEGKKASRQDPEPNYYDTEGPPF